MKIQADHIQPLLGPDAASPTKRSVLGVPVWSSPACDATEVWGLPKPKCLVVLRTGTKVVADSSAYFSSDRIGIRCTLRVGFAWPHQEAIVKIGVGGS